MRVNGFGRVRGTALAIVAALAIAEPGWRTVAHNRESKVTWTTDVEPILKKRCVGCHVTNGFGPMSLATYQEGRSWAQAIRQEVLERRMPPWPAARGFGEFINDRSLTQLEVDLLTAWADGNTPVGPPVVAAPESREHSVHHGAGAPTRSPDVVVTMPAAREVTRLTERYELATALTDDRWITGWEFRPGNRSVIEQAVVWILPSTLLGAWTPPEPAIVYPSGVAQRLPAGSRLAIDVRYRRAATPQRDQSGIALYFGGRPRRELQHQLLACGSRAIDRDLEVLAVTPRAGGAGESIEIVARRADGSVEPLAVVPRYEPAYPITYRLRFGLRLGRGTTIEVRSSAPDCAAGLDFT